MTEEEPPRILLLGLVEKTPGQPGPAGPALNRAPDAERHPAAPAPSEAYPPPAPAPAPTPPAPPPAPPEISPLRLGVTSDSLRGREPSTPVVVRLPRKVRAKLVRKAAERGMTAEEALVELARRWVEKKPPKAKPRP